jgi:hypothetical protein
LVLRSGKIFAKLATSIRDVYKTVGYAAPFTEEEKEKILERVNSLTEEQLSKFIAKKNSRNIIQHKDKFGLFTCVEQLLGEFIT